MNDLRITLVMPSFNQNAYIDKAIRSVLEQGYPNLEFMVFDGGSTDGSVETIRKYTTQIAYWQSGRDGGHANAIATGFNRASGEVLGWLNSDDLLLRGALSSVANAFSADNLCTAVTGRCVLIDANDRPFHVHIPRLRTVRGMIFWGHGLHQMATFWRRSSYVLAGGLDRSLDFAFDYDLFVRLRQLGHFKAIPEYLAAFRMHGSSKTSTIFRSVGLADHDAIRLRYGLTNPLLLRVAKLTYRLDPVRRAANRYFYLRHRGVLGHIVESSL